MLQVIADILQALDRRDFAALALLDLSAAFDTVDHATFASLATAIIQYPWHGAQLAKVIPQ